MRAGAPTPVQVKRGELERSDGALSDARRRLDRAAQRTREYPADRELDDLHTISLEIARLRRRNDRLQAELEAVEAEWL
jgi:hypothetical protein